MLRLNQTGKGRIMKGKTGPLGFAALGLTFAAPRGLGSGLDVRHLCFPRQIESGISETGLNSHGEFKQEILRN